MQELRGELGKRQRELINMKYDLEDSQYRLETATNSVNMLKGTVADYQERMIAEREQYEAAIKESSQRERRYMEEISSLREQLDQKSYSFQEPAKTVSFASTYSEEEVAALREQSSLKQRELSSLKYELEDKLFLLESL